MGIFSKIFSNCPPPVHVWTHFSNIFLLTPKLKWEGLTSQHRNTNFGLMITFFCHQIILMQLKYYTQILDNILESVSHYVSRLGGEERVGGAFCHFLKYLFSEAYIKI